MIKISFSFLPPVVLARFSKVFLGVSEFIAPMMPLLKLNLKQADIDLDVRQYISMCVFTDFFTFFFLFISFSMLIQSFGSKNSVFFGFALASVFVFFIFWQQMAYPKLVANRKVKGLERNLLPAMQNILVQINSGIPLFDVLVNVSKGDYGEVSQEFARAVKEINAGKPQIDALEDMVTVNPSILFRRTIWQIVNGMKTGADLSRVIKSSIDAVGEEQIIQIQKYGGQLSPLAMFYMLIAVIIPALGMTFLIIIASFINLSGFATKLVFWSLFGMIVFFQIMFLGVIKSRRPNLIPD